MQESYEAASARYFALQSEVSNRRGKEAGMTVLSRNFYSLMLLVLKAGVVSKAELMSTFADGLQEWLDSPHQDNPRTSQQGSQRNRSGRDWDILQQYLDHL